jgi:hypothetical protein
LLDPFRRISLPRYGCQVGLCIVLFEVCSAFTRVTACTLALPPYFVARFTEGFSGFVTSTAAPVASGGSTSPGGACTRWNNIAFSRRTPQAAIVIIEQPAASVLIAADGAKDKMLFVLMQYESPLNPSHMLDVVLRHFLDCLFHA